MGSLLWTAAPLAIICILQPLVQGQSDDGRYHGGDNRRRSISDSDLTVTSGEHHTCGVGAQPVCACLPDHYGDPLSKCVRAAACLSNSDCPTTQYCLKKHCIIPCDGVCGLNANCDVKNHVPICSCPTGSTGNPFFLCSILDAGQSDDDGRYHGGDNRRRSISDSDFKVTSGEHTCGVGAQPVCSCLPGYSGDPLSKCVRAECLGNSDCPTTQLCSNQHCVNPCAGTCGPNANCDVKSHVPICSCPTGSTGDPFVMCSLLLDADDFCEPNPCGTNANCKSGYDEYGAGRPFCTCPPGYTGNGLISCQKSDCETGAECAD